MNKKTVIVLLLSLIAILGWVVIEAIKENTPVSNQQEQVLLQTQDNNSEGENRVILYYGATCPHCEVVEEWLEENPKIKEKSGLTAKEVYENQKNSRELAEKVRECQIEESAGIGVPFLYDNGQCIIGDQLIIDYLKENYQ